MTRPIRRVARIFNTWTFTYLHPDHLGSPAAATDAGANLQWREDFTPFGEARQTPWQNDDQAGYTGHIHDADTGLTYMQARYYDPVIGRFLSHDPVGFADMGAAYFNRYAYVANDPVNHTDPTGEWIWVAAGAAIGGVVNTAAYHLTTPADQRTAAGYAANFAEGAVVGAVASSGVGLLTTLGAGAAANATENLVTDAAAGNLSNYTEGATGLEGALNAAGEVAGDLGAGASEAAVGKVAAVGTEGAAVALQAGRRLTQGTATTANALGRAEGDFAASRVANSVVAPIVDNSAAAVVVEAVPPPCTDDSCR